METLLEITGWIHYVGLAALVVYAGGLVVSVVGDVLQEYWREGKLTGSASLQESVKDGAR
jgi:hypothetical protein